MPLLRKRAGWNTQESIPGFSIGAPLFWVGWSTERCRSGEGYAFQDASGSFEIALSIATGTTGKKS
jgi:hypothetical protein